MEPTLVKDLVDYNLKVLVTGGSGQIGSEIKNLNKNLSFNFYFPESNELNLLDLDSISSYLNNNNFDLIINLAAFTGVDSAEENKKNANIVNHLAAGIIASEARKREIGLIHGSTDYVFGNTGGPYGAYDKKEPINYYGTTKSLGEDSVLNEYEKSIVIRFASVFSEYGNNFIKRILKSLIKEEIVKVVSDQKISLTYAGDFSKNIIEIINFYNNLEFDVNKNNRIFHLTCREYTNWFSVAEIIYDEANKVENGLLRSKLLPISSKDWKSIAQRSQDTRLELNDNFINESKINLSQWEKSVRLVVKRVLPIILKEVENEK